MAQDGNRWDVDPRYSKTYGSFDRAVSAAENILKKHEEYFQQTKTNPCYVIAAAGDNNDRFSPVFYRTDGHGFVLTHDGFSCIG